MYIFIIYIDNKYINMSIDSNEIYNTSRDKSCSSLTKDASIFDCLLIALTSAVLI